VFDKNSQLRVSLQNFGIFLWKKFNKYGKIRRGSGLGGGGSEQEMSGS
jgi:hypothetical protein